MMRAKIIKPFALALTGVLSIGTSAITVADTPTQGGTLVMALQQTPRHLNPAVQSGIATGVPGAQLFAAPLRYDERLDTSTLPCRELGSGRGRIIRHT